MKCQHVFFAVVLAAQAIGCGSQNPSSDRSGTKSERASKIKADGQQATVTETVTVTQTVTDTQTYTDTATATVSRSSTQTQTGTGTVTATSTRTATVTVVGTVTHTATSTATATATQTQGGVLSYNQIYVLTGTVTSTNTATVYYTQWAHSKGNTATATTTQYILTTGSKVVTATVTSTFNGTETKTVTATVTGSGTSTGTTTVTVTATMTSSSVNAGGGGRTVTATGTATNTATQSWTYHRTATVTLTATSTTTNTLTGTNTITTTVTSTTTPTVTTTNTVTVTTPSTVTQTVTNTTTSTRTTTSTATQTSTANYVVTPSALDFGSVGVGSTSAPMNLTVENPSGQAEPIPTVAFSAGETSHFSVPTATSTCDALGGWLGPNQTCTVAIVFSPTDAGVVTESVTVGGTTVALQGTGVSTTYVVTPSALDLGSVVLGSTSIPMDLTVQNPTGQWEPIPTVAFSGGETSHFSVSTATSTCDALGGWLGPNQTCTMAIFFSATEAGVVTESATVGGTTVALQGTGVSATYVVAPSALDLGSVVLGSTSIPMDLTVQNPTGQWEPVPTVAFSGGETSHFSVSTATSTCDALGGWLGPNQTCTMAIFFSATEAGVVMESATVGGTTVALQGTGVSATYVVAPSALDFGSVGVGSTSIPMDLTAQNPTGQWEPVPTVAFSGGETSHFFVSTATSTCDALGGWLGPNQTCTMAIFFSATGPGVVTESVTVGGTTVALQGAGLTAP